MIVCHPYRFHSSFFKFDIFIIDDINIRPAVRAHDAE